tara:strand:- start:4923 stop:5129 length:207 start_codon:yes stop_codon:yes gene_type:complete
MNITKHALVATDDIRDLQDGTVAFQTVTFNISYYGNEVVSTHDTRIDKDGKQTVIGGCGFIPHGFEVK